MFQSTHPHGVRQSQIEFYVELTKVSIHAPTRGATVLSRSGIRPMVSFNPRTHTGCDLGNTHKRFGYCVSIHAPTRGATKPKTFRYFVPRGFNPRTHTGCDLVVLTSSNNLIIVSIHAPTRGATFVYRGTDRPQFCRFNPRTHTGCDVM